MLGLSQTVNTYQRENKKKRHIIFKEYLCRAYLQNTFSDSLKEDMITNILFQFK